MGINELISYIETVKHDMAAMASEVQYDPSWIRPIRISEAERKRLRRDAITRLDKVIEIIQAGALKKNSWVSQRCEGEQVKKPDICFVIDPLTQQQTQIRWALSHIAAQENYDDGISDAMQAAANLLWRISVLRGQISVCKAAEKEFWEIINAI